MRTLAILADIHGNRIALQAVLNDLGRRGGADHLMVLGDLAVFGPDPSGVLALLHKYEPIFHVCGNTDRYLLEKRYPTSPYEGGWQAQVLASFPWTAHQLGEVGLRFLTRLPHRQFLNLTGEHPILAVHASPRSDEENIYPDTTETELKQILQDNLPYTLLLCGHTHVPMDRLVAGQRVVNVGSVGLPFDGDPRAGYTLIHLMPGGRYQVEMRRVAYDVEAVVEQLYAVAHPAAEVQAFNLRTARRLDSQLIYTPAMRGQGSAVAEPQAQQDFQAAMLLSRLAQVTS
jgi:diadenosine tetraphosphatase ApaH/serine/threonine PP2A family protein phosphatase